MPTTENPRLNAPIRSPFRIALLVEVIGPGAFEELDEEQADETGRDQQGGGPLGLRELFLRLDDCARQIVGVLLKRGGPIRLALVSRLLHFAEHPLVVALELLHPRTLLRAQVAPQTLAERDEGEKLQDGEQAEDSPHAAGAGPERPGESGGPIEGPHRPVGGLDSRESLGVVGAIHSAESLDRLAEVESGIRRRRSRTDGALGAGRHYASSSRRKRPLHDPVQDHRAEEDREPREETLSLGHVLERDHDVLTQALRSDQGRDHHHREAQQDGLVHPRS